jgi:hypothetical protein
MSEAESVAVAEITSFLALLETRKTLRTTMQHPRKRRSEFENYNTEAHNFPFTRSLKAFKASFTPMDSSISADRLESIPADEND